MADPNKKDSGEQVMEAHAGTTVPKESVAGVRGEPPGLRVAKLGGIEGLGLITAMRGAEGSIVEGNGTWRATDVNLDVNALRDLFAEGAETTYQGYFYDDGKSGTELSELEAPVKVTGVVEYEDLDGKPVRIVNFLYEAGQTQP